MTMPAETPQAVQWALTQTYENGPGSTAPITANTIQPLVDAVRSYFNTHNIAYTTFSFNDLQPFV